MLKDNSHYFSVQYFKKNSTFATSPWRYNLLANQVEHRGS